MSYELLLGVAFKSTVIVSLAWLAAWCLRRKSAAGRHLVWTAAAGALVALPVLSVAIPAWSVPSPISVDAGMVFRAFSTAAAPTETGGPAAIRTVNDARKSGNTPRNKTNVNLQAVVAGIWGVGSLA